MTSSISLDPRFLAKNSVIGSAMAPCEKDPELRRGVALTVLRSLNDKFIEFEDIDDLTRNQRYWNDIFLIVAWDDPTHSAAPLHIGDEVLALSKNPDQTFTTVYYRATIRALPRGPRQPFLVIHYFGEPQGTSVIMKARTSPITTPSGIVHAPTVIRKICAEGSAVQKAAIEVKRKRKYAVMNAADPTHSGTVAAEPPTKRRKRRRAQTLRIPKRQSPTSQVPIPTVAPTVAPAVTPILSNITQPMSSPAASQKTNPRKAPLSAKSSTGKRRIKLRVRRNSKVSKPKVEPSMKDSVTFQYLSKQNFAQDLVIEATKLFGDETNRALLHCQNRTKERVIPELPRIGSTRSITPSAAPLKLRKLWGRYQVALPMLPDKGNLFKDDDAYLSELAQSIGASKTEQSDDGEDDGFLSALGIKHKWTQPRDIGELTVGPYATDISICR